MVWNPKKSLAWRRWPDWNPPEQMIERQPYLPRFMAGGEGNPARGAGVISRRHLVQKPMAPISHQTAIGTFVSSGCIRLTNR